MDCRPLMLLLLAACSSPAEVAERTGQGEGAKASAAASAKSAEGRKVSEDTDLYNYELSYPSAVAAIPALAARIEEGAAKGKAEMIAEAKSAQADSEQGDYTFNPHSFSEEWQVVADLPGYLSLSNLYSSYTGGAHGMYGLAGLVWDKRNGRGFPSEELFQSPSYLGSTMGDALCDALKRERVNKGMEPSEDADSVFADCPGLDEATVLVGSSNGKVGSPGTELEFAL